MNNDRADVNEVWKVNTSCFLGGIGIAMRKMIRLFVIKYCVNVVIECFYDVRIPYA